MSEHVNQSLTIDQSMPATCWIGGMAENSYSETVRSSSKNVPAMTEPFSSQPHQSNELERPQKYPVRLMYYQEDSALLGQQINQIISSSAPEMVLERVAQVLGEAFQVDCCSITVIDGNSDPVQTADWYSDNHPEVPSKAQQMLLSRHVALEVMPSADIVSIDDVQAVETSLLTGWRLPLPIRAVMAIPTQFQGQINGVVSLLCSSPHQWTELEKERAKHLAAPVAIAIAQVGQNTLIASLKQQVHTSSQYQNLSNRLTMASRSSLDLNQIFHLALSGTAEVLQVTRGLILMLKYADPLFKSREREHSINAKATVVCECKSGPALPHQQQDTLLNQSFLVSECFLCQQAIKNTPIPVVIADQYDLPAIDLTTEIAPLFNIVVLPALLLFPLESQGKVLGFLVLQHSSPRLFTSEELALLELVSAQVSAAIIQSQRLRQVQSLVEERTAQLQRSLEVQAKLYEKTRRQLDQLRQLNQLKDEFLSTMSHELRTPLTSMNLAIRMLRQPGLAIERQARYLDILEQQCSQEINLINDLLTLQELESHQVALNLVTIDLKALLQNLAWWFEEKWADKGLTISVNLPKTSLLLKTDPNSIERILKELLTNAGKYSAPNTAIVLRAAHQVNQIVVTLTNLGPGISPDDLTYIFDKFRRGQGATQQAIQGTGLGLALVKSLVQHLNGTIDVSSSPDSNSSMSETCFTLTLPQFFDHVK